MHRTIHFMEHNPGSKPLTFCSLLTLSIRLSNSRNLLSSYLQSWFGHFLLGDLTSFLFRLNLWYFRLFLLSEAEHTCERDDEILCKPRHGQNTEYDSHGKQPFDNNICICPLHDKVSLLLE